MPLPSLQQAFPSPTSITATPTHTASCRSSSPINSAPALSRVCPAGVWCPAQHACCNSNTVINHLTLRLMAATGAAWAWWMATSPCPLALGPPTSAANNHQHRVRHAGCTILPAGADPACSRTSLSLLQPSLLCPAAVLVHNPAVRLIDLYRLSARKRAAGSTAPTAAAATAAVGFVSGIKRPAAGQPPQEDGRAGAKRQQQQAGKGRCWMDINHTKLCHASLPPGQPTAADTVCHAL